MDLTIAVHASGPVRIVRMEGSCDLATAPRLRQTLQPFVPPEVSEVVLDVSALEFIDSTGLGVVLGALRRMREGGGTLRIEGATGIVKRVLEITDLDKVIPLGDGAAAVD